MTTTTPQAQPFTERPDFAPVHTPAPLWKARRGQIANLWLYAYCAILSPFVLPLVYATWRAVDTFWHRYELLPNRLRITTGLYRPNIHTEEVDFDTVQGVRVEGFRLYRLVNRGDVVLVRAGGLNPVRIEGIKDPEGIKTLIDGALERWRPRSVAR
jgi:hypothetical protein